LLTCSDCDVLSKVLQIFVLLVKLGPEFVRSYLLSEWISRITNTIVPANINLQFVRNTYNYMVECIGSLSGSDATKLTIVHSERIPDFLMVLFLIEKESFFEYFTNMIDLLKRSFSPYDDVAGARHRPHRECDPLP
jgi:hypothetical protein